MRLRWKDGGEAPIEISFGSSTVIGDVAYFSDFFTDAVCAYDASTKKWDDSLPQCRQHDLALVAVNGLLTAVGKDGKLLSLVGEGENRTWEELLPSMPTKRGYTVAVCSGKTLVVIGGETYKHGRLKVVELLDTDSLQWSIASELAVPLKRVSATVCGDNLYLVGGFSETKGGLRPTKSVFTCSLSALIKSARPVALGGESEKAFAQTEEVWHEVASLPVVHSTCASLNGQLIAVGGYEKLPSNSIYAYDPTTDHWDVISTMPTARHNPVVAVLPGNQLMVVGGFPGPDESDIVEIATF